MSLNRTVSDLKVKRIKIQRKSGNRWVSMPSDKRIHPGTKYRLLVYFGNTGGMINYEGETYRKDLVNIRVVGKGFKMKSGEYKYRNNIIFYTNSSFNQQVGGAKYRTSFDLASFDTHHADCLFYAYLMFAGGTPSYNVTKLRWSNGIYASVRNRNWRERATVV